MLEMDDFLWDCALETKSKDFFDKDDSVDSNVSQCMEIVLYNKSSNMSNMINGVVLVKESKGFGIFDTIGGALWEAALLLCAHILQNVLTFQCSDILELGSGVGLPGLLLIHVRQLLISSSSNLTFSDNDSSVITVLRNIISHQFLEVSPSDDSSSAATHQFVKLVNLDWKVFAPICEDSDLDCDWIDEIQQNNNTQHNISPHFDNSNFDMLMGSALCYTTDHVCLADLIKYYLSGRCNTVQVCQIGDREGFSLLLERLVQLDVWHEVQPIKEETYRVAQRIRRCTSSSSMDGAKEEEEVQYRSSQYDFRHCSPLFGGEPGCETHELLGEWRSDLLTTPRSAFVMLTAKKGSHRERSGMTA